MLWRIVKTRSLKPIRERLPYWLNVRGTVPREVIGMILKDAFKGKQDLTSIKIKEILQPAVVAQTCYPSLPGRLK